MPEKKKMPCVRREKERDLREKGDLIAMMSHYHNLILNKDCFELYNRWMHALMQQLPMLLLIRFSQNLSSSQICVLHLADPATSEREESLLILLLSRRRPSLSS